MLVQTEAEALDAFAFIQSADQAPLVMDTEATGKDWQRDRVVSVQLLAGDRAFYFPFRHQEGPNLPENYLRRIAEDILRPEREQHGFHYAFDMKIMTKEGMRLPLVIQDPMLAAHLMNENEPDFKMKNLAVRYVDERWADADQELTDAIVARFGGSAKSAKGDLWRMPATEVVRYGEDDVFMVRALLDFYRPHLEDWKLWDIFLEVCEFQLALCEIELRGMLLDMAKLDELEAEAQPKAAALRRAIEEQAQADLQDPTFPANPRSHPQMKRWLGTVLGVPDTSKKTLQLDGDPRGQLLLDFRIWDKLVGSFVKPYREKVAPDGCIHCNMFITSPGVRESNDDPVHGTVSDRVSSTDPNMQQVPPAARKAFIAWPDHELVELDYSQAELRLAAHYYETRFNDFALGSLLRAGKDLHQATADEAGIPRKAAKIRNFAIQYGAGARKLAAMNQTREKDERQYLNTYHRMFPGCRRLQRQCTAEAEARGYIRLWTGRTRRYNTPKAASYKASNNLIQGGIAQMLRRALIRVRREVPEAKMVLTVHDSILFQIPVGRRDLIDRLRSIMQDQPWCTLPMVVDAKVGQSWGDLEELPRTVLGIPAAALEGVTDPSLVAA